MGKSMPQSTKKLKPLKKWLKPFSNWVKNNYKDLHLVPLQLHLNKIYTCPQKALRNSMKAIKTMKKKRPGNGGNLSTIFSIP